MLSFIIYMKKLILSLLFSLCVLNAFALEVSDYFTYNSSFWRNSAAVSVRPWYSLSAGAGFDVTNHDDFGNHIYALRMPITLMFEDTTFALTPFYYPDNANRAQAYGARAELISLINRNDIENTATRFRMGAALASQKADMFKNGSFSEQETFNQAAYELDLSFGYFEQYFFDITGNIYQYLSGIDGVESFFGVMNQAEIADLGTNNYVLGLPYYSAGARIRWKSDVSNSDNFISYRYVDFYNTGNGHSVLISSTMRMGFNFYLNLAYNHIFRAGPDVDIYTAGMILKF